MSVNPQRILVVQPSWVGDAVMATPALRALRELYPRAQISDLLLQLFVTDSERREAEQILSRTGLDSQLDRPAACGLAPLIVLNPGAQYGAAKCWLPEYFAQLGDRFVEEVGATILISAAPKERAIVDQIARKMKHAAVDLPSASPTLGSLKDIIRQIGRAHV